MENFRIRVKEANLAMVRLVLRTLLGFVAVSFAQYNWTFQEGAEDLVSVGYWTDWDGKTAVDRI